MRRGHHLSRHGGRRLQPYMIHLGARRGRHLSHQGSRLLRPFLIRLGARRGRHLSHPKGRRLQPLAVPATTIWALPKKRDGGRQGTNAGRQQQWHASMLSGAKQVGGCKRSVVGA